MTIAGTASSYALAVDRLILTPTAEGVPSAAGRVRTYDAGAAGLAVRITAQVAPHAAEQLHGQRTWVTANVGDRLLAFQAVVRQLSADSVDASGITVPVEEYRRGQLRAATEVPADLRLAPAAGAEPAMIAAYTVDLSRGGCRVQLPRRGTHRLPPVGSHADVTLHLGRTPTQVACDVLRVDPVAGQAVLQFDGLGAADADIIERHVLALVLAEPVLRPAAEAV